MKYTRFISSFVLAGLIFTSCKKNETIRETSAEAVSEVQKTPIAPENLQTATFKIEGMTCAVGCAKTIEKELSDSNGVQEAKIDFDKKIATVTFDKTVQNQESLTNAVQEVGDGKTYKVSDFKS